MSSPDKSDFSDLSQSGDLLDEMNHVIATNINLEETFRLVDHLFSHQDCFYHEILPLAMNSQCLTLAMVEPDDTSALNFVNSILESVDYSCNLKIATIDKDTVKAILSVYHHRNLSNSKAVQPTTLVEKSTLILDKLEPRKAEQEKPPLSKKASSSDSERLSTLKFLRSLDIYPQHLSNSPEFLATLPAEQLLAELLGQVLLNGGIGRLYWERNLHSGRILASRNGTAQTVVDHLPLETFQGTIDELKKLAHLNADPIQKTKKLEIARLYENKPLLLRLRLMANKYGDEATLQILRGKALMFYQKHQMDKLAQETLQLAQQLDRKLTQIKLRTQFNPTPVASLPELQKLVEKLTQRLKSIEN